MADSNGPLSSLAVLDFSTLIPGPFATMVLADLGADVIRVEAPARADAVRDLPPGSGSGSSSWHEVLARSKRSIRLDLKNDAGKQVAARLLRRHNIVVEQFRPGVMERLGLGYEALRAVDPGVIYCSINSFGSSAGESGRAAHDVNALALAGVLATGRSAEPLGIQVADLGAAMNAVAGILAAVIHRAETGTGQRVEASLFDSALMWNTLAASEVLAGAGEARAAAGMLNGGSRYGVYETADGRHLALGGLEGSLWGRFCDAAGRPDLAADALGPVEPALRDEIAELVRGRTLDHWVDLLDGVDACADPVLTVAEAVDRAVQRHPEMIVDVGDGARRQQQVGNAIRLSETPPTYRHPGHLPGADRDEILAELGYDDREIGGLEAAGAFG